MEVPGKELHHLILRVEKYLLYALSFECFCRFRVLCRQGVKRIRLIGSLHKAHIAWAFYRFHRLLNYLRHPNIFFFGDCILFQCLLEIEI